ncbi:MAG: Rpn family recombination-promoting nuclease/putative transposase [Lachnospiraceae bacterium]|nr:Rpn family recombination-promoting nuclease/putative transposase [Lachnospiraceae bacterium]
MGQSDLYQSDFYEDKGRFADVFNGILFGGKEIMKPEELEPEDSVIVGMEKKRNLKKVICDKIRRWKGRYVSIMVLENQSYVDYRMVLRVMESEVIGYDKQRKEAYLAKCSEKVKFDSVEYLSRMKKEQKFIPIITLVLYVGKDKMWDGSRSLYELLEMDEEIKPFVNDFKLNLFDYHDYKDFSMFKTENRLLFEMLANAKDKKKMFSVLRRHTHSGEVDEISAKAILGILNVKIDLAKIMKIDEQGREVYDMCQAFEDYKEDGRREGRKEGRREGKKEGKQEMALKMVKNLMRKQKISFEEAANILGITKRMQKELTTLI